MDDAERHHVRFVRERERTARRGETIAMVFAMQGVGAVVGSVFLVCLIYFGEQGRVDCDIEGYNPHGQSTEALSAIWRTFYFIGMLSLKEGGIWRVRVDLALPLIKILAPSRIHILIC